MITFKSTRSLENTFKTYHIDIHDNWNRIRYKGTVFTLSKKNNTFDRKEIRFIIEMEYQAKDIIPIHPIM